MKNIQLDITKATQFLQADAIAAYEPKVKAAQEALENGTCPGNDFLGWLHLPSSITPDFIGELNATAQVLHGSCFFHVGGTGHELCDVETGHGNRQQAYGSEYGETSAHIVGDDKALVSFLVSRGTGGTFLGIGYGHDDFAGHVLAALVFALLFQQAESQSRFSCGS